MPVLHSWLGSRRTQLPSFTNLLAPGLGATARSNRRALTGSRRRRSRMMTIILLRLIFAHDPGQVLAIGNRIRVLRPKSFLTDADCKGQAAVTTPCSPVPQAGE